MSNETPRVDALIDCVMKRYHGVSAGAQARYFEAVHQELAPLARELEIETQKLRAERDAAVDAERAAWRQLQEKVKALRGDAGRG